MFSSNGIEKERHYVVLCLLCGASSSTAMGSGIHSNSVADSVASSKASAYASAISDAAEDDAATASIASNHLRRLYPTIVDYSGLCIFFLPE